MPKDEGLVAVYEGVGSGCLATPREN